MSYLPSGSEDDVGPNNLTGYQVNIPVNKNMLTLVELATNKVPQTPQTLQAFVNLICYPLELDGKKQTNKQKKCC